MIPDDTPHEFLHLLKGEAVDFITQSKHDTYVDLLSILIFVIQSVTILSFPLSFGILILLVGTALETAIAGSYEYVAFSLFATVVIFYFDLLLIKFVLSHTTRKGPWYAVTNDSLYEYRSGITYKYRWDVIVAVKQIHKTKSSISDLLLFLTDNVDKPEIAVPVSSKAKFYQHPFARIYVPYYIFRERLLINRVENAGLMESMIRHNLRHNKPFIG